MCLLIGTRSQMSDVAHGSLVFVFGIFFTKNLILFYFVLMIITDRVHIQSDGSRNDGCRCEDPDIL